MWLLAKKKGVSIMVGYVLLVTCAVIMGVLVYHWIKTYIPTEALECPGEVSIFIKEYTYDCASGSEKLTITLKNNGLFNTAGYFIHATNDSNQTLAIIDLSGYTKLGEGKGGTVLFRTSSENSFKPNDEITNVFNLADSGIGRIYLIEIVPVRFQEVDNKIRFVSCGGSRVKEEIVCGVACVPDCAGKECGDDGCSPYDETDCGTCTGAGEVCNISGQCVVCTPDCSCASTTCVGETCVDPVCSSNCEGTLEPDCGTRVCGPAPNGCGNETVCGPCDGTCVDGVCEGAACGGADNITGYEDYCLYAGDFGESCTTVCLTHGGSAGAVNDNVDGCFICYHFYPGASSCGEKPENWLPAYKNDGKCLANKEFLGWDVDASDGAYSRFCACNN